MDLEIEKIKELLDAGRVDDALYRLNGLLSEGRVDDRLYFLRGKLHWKIGNRREAMTDYESAVAINSASPARHALEMARDINDFFNPDLLNP